MEILSSIVNDSIREFYTFLLEDPTRAKSTKSDFLHLRCFMRTKSTKSIRRQASDVFLLDVFMSTKTMFYFIRLCTFCAFMLKKQLSFS